MPYVSIERTVRVSESNGAVAAKRKRKRKRPGSCVSLKPVGGVSLKSRIAQQPPDETTTFITTDGFVTLPNSEVARLNPPQGVADLARDAGYDALLAPSQTTWVMPGTVPMVGDTPVEMMSPWDRGRPKATKKIAIVGKAPQTIGNAPYADPEWEIWGLSDLILHPDCKRWSRWFELHDPEGWHPDDSVPRRKKWHPDYWKHLTAKHDGQPIYIAEPHPEMPHAELFPYERLIERFSLRGQDGKSKPYFTNTVSWLIAFAIDQGATHISIYGVDMAQQERGVKSEYAYQRPSCEYFIGWAAGYGVEVFIPDNSDLMKATRLYGIDRLSPNMRSLHRKRKKDLQKLRDDVEQKLAQAKQQVKDLELRQHVIIGAQDDNDQWWGQQVL